MNDLAIRRIGGIEKVGDRVTCDWVKVINYSEYSIILPVYEDS